mmetsp:Transcript_29623/g.84956  ORF Transcript_29623/g.84956 Transcript_29623/m.84956 type:complete len:320 (+) Transcript_29623:69-1028(+)
MQSVHIHGERKNCLGTNPRSSQHMSMCTGATDVRRQFCELRPNLTAETHKINTCKDGRSARFGPAPTHLEGLRLHGGARLRPAAHSMTAHWLLRVDIHSLTSSFDFVRAFPDSALALRCAAASACRTSSCSAREHGRPLPKSFFSSAITLALEPVGVDSISSHPSRKRLNTSARSLASRFCALGALGAACAACSASSSAFNSASASAASSAAAASASKASSAPSSKAFAGSFKLFLCTAALVHGDRSRVGAPSSHGSSAPLPRNAGLQQPVKHLHNRTMMSRSTSSPSAKPPAAIETPSPPKGSSTMASERSRCAICTT